MKMTLTFNRRNVEHIVGEFVRKNHLSEAGSSPSLAFDWDDEGGVKVDYDAEPVVLRRTNMFEGGEDEPRSDQA